MAKSKKKALGKGLGALISLAPDVDAAASAQVEPVAEGERILQLDPQALSPNPKQARTTFSEEPLEELAQSIRRDGVQEPVIVRKTSEGYELVSGERRVRACIMAGLETVPAICRDVSDADMLKLGLIENIHREDLNPIELAMAYQALIDEFHWTQEQLATEVGKNRVTVTNTLRLLKLPPDLQNLLADGSLSSGHAKALLSIESPDRQRAGARKIVVEGLSVRQAEKLAVPPKPKPKKTPETRDPNVVHVEEELQRRLGTKVTLHALRKRRGKIEIEYYSHDDLERILELLRGKE